MAAYFLSPLAVADLEGILEYTLANWGEEQFDRYRKAMTLALESLARTPLARGSKARDDLMQGCRFFRVEHHYIVYRSSPHGIEVGRILHERMNFELQVEGDPFTG
ncbi:type II toxin-antitoxin system RelE/ParE family toxin [Luteolibacter flavescens]|uniref:Toxin n=1 Tax=Luteolibacter flavescens TaxID=1859460 RepID=A0ABT3FIU1_9BACT|nr:type II toxin-antitoxin system RelE/ParE family toxin [Luteolibacter flavescens]MCW1883478.1 type II toxin-antitoxin system RelE/ParE family toxin [Luteolibacter flavescens]